jgi:DNA (cytosine-5)-methyltransferase 1
MDQPNALTYVELFAGAGGMSLGLETAGWRCVAHAEIEPHARAVLRQHWPDVPLYGDVTTLDGTQFKGVTMVTGGSPCQDLSIAGKRAGMVEGSGTRSSLFFEQVRIWNESEAPYILWENVYGAFSSNAGRDFAAVLSALVGAAVPVPSDGWVRAGVVAGPAGVAAWRTLDAQYFGVPQRRRRVFVLGARAGGVDPAEVFALAESLSGHLAASGEAGEGVAADAGTGAALAVNISDGVGRLDSVMGTLDADGASTTAIGAQTRGVVLPILEATARQGSSTEGSVGIGEDGDPMFTLQATKQHGVLAFAQNTRDEVRIVTGDKICALAAQPGMKQQNYVLTYEWHNQDSRIREVKVASSLNLNAEGREGHLILPQSTTVGIPRRLTPVECERLMGWPDQHTAHGISEKGKAYALADTARYKLCGNGIASPVTAWIGFQMARLLTSDK